MFMRLAGLIFPTIFVVLVLRSIYSLYSTFQAPICDPKIDQVCYTSFLNNKPSLDLYIFLTDNSKSGIFELVLKEDKFQYDKPFERDISVRLSDAVRNNGSVFIYTVVVPNKPRKKDISLHELLNTENASFLKNKLTKHALPASATFNLLNNVKSSKKNVNVKPVSHIYSLYSIVICTETLNIPHNEIPFEIIRHLRVNNDRKFLPIMHRDFLHMRQKDLQEITADMKSTVVKFAYQPVQLGKMRFLLQIEATLYQFLDLGFTEKDLDEVKGVFVDTNLYLLCATMCIGSIHLLLDFLSFKNDVSFWRSQKSMAGLSSRTVLWRAFSQTIVFLYLLDEGTSLLVLIPSGIATLIEFWKVSKVLKTSISWNGVEFNKYNKESQEEIETRKYDEECMRYLSYLLYPLCIGAAIYSLLYQPHKGWYSWTINSLVNGVYAFGFLFMLPQLFINYRLKSVAALPWRAFTYRAFNTFIDDIFAFIITMPTAHRVACFRDDVIFLVYLYQRWLYPVDKSRTDDVTGEIIPEKSQGTAEENKKDK